MRLCKRPRQTPAIRPTERRMGRSGCVHPDTIGSGRACRKTSGNLLSFILNPDFYELASCAGRQFSFPLINQSARYA
jgi:hypothetical protein